jgi:hypothetical protein
LDTDSRWQLAYFGYSHAPTKQPSLGKEDSLKTRLDRARIQQLYSNLLSCQARRRARAVNHPIDAHDGSRIGRLYGRDCTRGSFLDRAVEDESCLAGKVFSRVSPLCV